MGNCFSSAQTHADQAQDGRDWDYYLKLHQARYPSQAHPDQSQDPRDREYYRRLHQVRNPHRSGGGYGFGGGSSAVVEVMEEVEAGADIRKGG